MFDLRGRLRFEVIWKSENQKTNVERERERRGGGAEYF